MSNVKLRTPSNGSVTLSPADTASDVVVTVPAGTAELLTNSSGVLNIGSGQIYKDASGNVGIGTSSPGAKLHVNGGDIQLSAGNSLKFSANAYITPEDNVQGARISAPGVISMWTGATPIERARIDASGNLLLNTTSVLNGSKFTIDATSTWGLGIRSTINSGVNYFVQFFNGATGVGSITANGTTTSYTTSSDYRLKESITPMTGALAKNELLNPVTYKWKVDGSDGQGFIAHELQAVFPDAVTGTKDAVDDEGKPAYQGVDTSFLVAHLVACVKEQQSMITQLQSRIEALENA